MSPKRDKSLFLNFSETELYLHKVYLKSLRELLKMIKPGVCLPEFLCDKAQSVYSSVCVCVWGGSHLLSQLSWLQQESYYDFRAILGYSMSSRVAWMCVRLCLKKLGGEEGKAASLLMTKV